MPHCIRKNRISWAGLLLPVFFLFALGVLSLGAYPGWIRPVLGVPGTQCDTVACDSGSPFATVCDACNSEFCSFNQIAQQFQCAVNSGSGISFDPAATPTPACPLNDPNQPGCWTSCTEQLNQNNPVGFCEEAICAPSDSFCDGISGGTASNECRNGVCQTSPQVDPANPSGCDYDLTPGATTECRNCIPEGLATLENCGNGICEPDEGEACDTCAIDCLLPGFEDTCPLTSGSVIGQACSNPPPSIAFDGPPYNDPFSGECEDGDLCTDNTCGVGAAPVCTSTPKSCDPDGDFCCPAGCAAPTSGGTCREVTGAPIPGCDPDCYVPVDCVPTPLPTPPVFVGCLEGSGMHGNNGGPGCTGFSCSLSGQADVSAPMGFLAFAGLALLGVVSFRKRHG